MTGHIAGGGEEVSVGCIIAEGIHFSCACCGKIVLRRSGSADFWSHAHSSSVAERIRAMGSKVVPAPDTSVWCSGRHHPSHLGKRHAVGRARGDTGCSGSNPCLRAGTTRIVRHVTTCGEHYAHSSKDDRSAGVSKGQGITARGAGNVRTDRRCYLTIAHRPVAEVDWPAACARFALRLARRCK
jgi:hypothetical protein